MLTYPEISMIIARDRQQELIAEADHQRLLRAARRARRERTKRGRPQPPPRATSPARPAAA